jgi:hypothetical protein
MMWFAALLAATRPQVTTTIVTIIMSHTTIPAQAVQQCFAASELIVGM